MYQHTQRAGPVLLVLGAAGLVPLAVLFLGPGRTLAAGPRLTLAATALVIGSSAVAFSSLTIRVAEGQLEWYFGPGVLRKQVPLAGIADASPTATSFIEGWGIHLTTRGWLYNVAGRQAVLVTRRDGRRFLLGTDEPAALAAAIRAARGPEA